MASRLFGGGGGTSLPGMVARRVDPHILETLVGRCDVPVVAITGSNGKTTTSRFATELLRDVGIPVVQNRTGSNLVQGVTSMVVGSADLRGRLPNGMLVAEVDEGALPGVASELDPRALLVTGLFRDQLDRFGELYAVAHAIDSVAAAMPEDAVLVVNADDPLVADIARGRIGRRLTFGLALDRSTDRLTSAADTVRCPHCGTDLVYTHIYLSHLGAYRCEACGFARPPLDVAVTELEIRGLGETRLKVQLPHESLEIVVPQAGLHVAYDVAGALAICLGLGLRVDGAPRALARVPPAFGRLERIEAEGRTIVLAFVKNPTSFNTTLRTLAELGEPRRLLMAFSNTRVDGEDFGWLWDVDAESIATRVEEVTVSGLRADEVANRLKYAGVDPALMEVHSDRPAALSAALQGVPPGGTLVVLGSYTPTIELREEMRRRGWVERWWQA